ncbi:MAG: glycoside hydrolase family 20 zincin-like fold domain-containing protein [Acidimicrobiia bacterium]
MAASLNLLPVPREVLLGEGTVAVSEPIVRIGADLPAEGYELRIGREAIELDAADSAGAFYGRATLAQLGAIAPVDGEVPIVTIRDWPDLPVRAVMLDVSRDKVPTMATVRDLVARLASWKVNQVQLYVEHTFAYAGHEEVWADASPFTPDEIRELDAWCAQHHVELVANQNCLGHMGRWLRHEPYRSLAMAPEGFTDHLGRQRAPMTIDPAHPGSLGLVRDLLAQLLPCFTSSRVHIGLDEPWEMPDERVGEYLDWVERLAGVPELAGHDLLMWGDIVAGHPDRLARLPDNVTVCEWGYEEWWPFDERAAAYAAASTPFWVCPGTSSWTTILGRTTNMRGDAIAAATAATAHGGSGFLNTDWGDQGHLQYLPVSEPGFAFGAATSWCLDTNRDLDLATALDAHAFGDEAGVLGRALTELGDGYRDVTPQVPNTSAVVLHLYYPQLTLGRGPTKGARAAEFERLDEKLAGIAMSLDGARPTRPDGALVLDELRNAIALVRVLCGDAIARLAGDGTLESVDASTRARLSTGLERVIEAHSDLWLARNRPGGLDDSVAWLAHLRDCYRTGMTDRTWGSHYIG